MGRIECGYRGPDIVSNGLVLYLDANSRSSYKSFSRGDNGDFGTTWKDISGNGNDGTLVNNPTFSSANNGSFVFNGSTTYVGPISNYSTYFNFGPSNSAFTISLFIRPTSTPSFSVLLASTRKSNPIGRWDWGLWFSGGKLEAGTEGLNNRGNTTLSVNTIYQAALTYSPNVQTFYLNGVSDGTFTQALSNNGDQEILIGTRQDCCRFEGNIYNVQIYNRALSASEVLSNYNALKQIVGS